MSPPATGAAGHGPSGSTRATASSRASPAGSTSIATGSTASTRSPTKARCKTPAAGAAALAPARERARPSPLRPLEYDLAAVPGNDLEHGVDISVSEPAGDDQASRRLVVAQAAQRPQSDLPGLDGDLLAQLGNGGIRRLDALEPRADEVHDPRLR